MLDDGSDMCPAGKFMDAEAHVARRKAVDRHRKMKRTKIYDCHSDLYVKPISRTERIKLNKAGKTVPEVVQNPDCPLVYRIYRPPKLLPKHVANQLDAWMLEENRFHMKLNEKPRKSPYDKLPLDYDVEYVPQPKLFRMNSDYQILDTIDDVDVTVAKDDWRYVALARHYRDQRRRSVKWPQIWCTPLYSGSETPSYGTIMPDPADWVAEETEDFSLTCAQDFTDEEYSDADDNAVTSPPAQTRRLSGAKQRVKEESSAQPKPSTSRGRTSSCTVTSPPATTAASAMSETDGGYAYPNDAIAASGAVARFEVRKLMNNDNKHQYDDLLDLSTGAVSAPCAYPIDEITTLLNQRLSEAKRQMLSQDNNEWPASSDCLSFDTFLPTHFDTCMPLTGGGLSQDALSRFHTTTESTALRWPCNATTQDLLTIEQFAHNILNCVVASITVNEYAKRYNKTIGSKKDVMGRLCNQQEAILIRTRDMAINLLAFTVFARRAGHLLNKFPTTTAKILAKRCTVAWSEDDLVEW